MSTKLIIIILQYIHVKSSCTPKTNIMLYVNYIPIEKRKTVGLNSVKEITSVLLSGSD